MNDALVLAALVAGAYLVLRPQPGTIADGSGMVTLPDGRTVTRTELERMTGAYNVSLGQQACSTQYADYNYMGMSQYAGDPFAPAPTPVGVTTAEYLDILARTAQQPQGGVITTLPAQFQVAMSGLLAR